MSPMTSTESLLDEWNSLGFSPGSSNFSWRREEKDINEPSVHMLMEVAQDVIRFITNHNKHQS